MSDEIPGPEVKGMIVVDDWVDESVLGAWHFATPEEVVSLVRRGVESGTIEGEVVDLIQNWFGEDLFVMNEAPHSPAAPNLPKGVYLLIGPVSDGGSET